MNKFRLAALAALLLPTNAFSYDYDPDALEPPDADIYIEFLGARSDFGGFHASYGDGFRARAGLQMNDSRVGNWIWRFEGGLLNLGEGKAKDSNTVFGSFLGNPGKIAERRETKTRIRINGFDFGLRLYDNEMFYVRGGGFLYSLKTDTDQRITDIYADPNLNTSNTVSNTDSSSGIAPYAGAGIEFPFVDESAKLVLEYDYLNIDSNDLHSMALGVQLSF